MKEEHWLNPDEIDNSQLYNGNSVLRGGRPTNKNIIE
jgi:hypothetical protein